MTIFDAQICIRISPTPLVPSLTTHLPSPNLVHFFAGIDASLNQVLVGLETLLAGVLNLVADL